jgi:hypothetical protein
MAFKNEDKNNTTNSKNDSGPKSDAGKKRIRLNALQEGAVQRTEVQNIEFLPVAQAAAFSAQAG